MTDEQKVRAQFEAYVIQDHHCSPDDFKWDESRNCYAMWVMHFAYQAWEARDALSHASAKKVPGRDRPSKCPGGMECSTCGCIFIGDESHDECGVCVEQGRDVAFAKDTVTIAVGREMFRFNSFQQWVNKAQSWFKRAGVPASQFVCIDATGRICGMGKQFMSARDRGAFPVIVYDIDPSTASGADSASATAEECSVVGDAARLDALQALINSGQRIEFAKSIFGNGVEIGLRSPCIAKVANTIRDAIDQAFAAKRGDQL